MLLLYLNYRCPGVTQDPLPQGPDLHQCTFHHTWIKGNQHFFLRVFRASMAIILPHPGLRDFF